MIYLLLSNFINYLFYVLPCVCLYVCVCVSVCICVWFKIGIAYLFVNLSQQYAPMQKHKMSYLQFSFLHLVFVFRLCLNLFFFVV